MRTSFHSSLTTVPAAEWNNLLSSDFPHLSHEFLLTLEESGAASTETGWTPCHITLETDSPSESGLIGAVPLYLKYHSYGEYIFDWAWAHAYSKAGLEYYPKLLSGVPFTPITGPKLLIRKTPDSNDIRHELIKSVHALAEEHNASSIHWLFIDACDDAALVGNGFLPRTGNQFHWENRAYPDFTAYLATMSSRKRKNIARERRRVVDDGVTFRWYDGDTATPEHWRLFYGYYRSTIEQHGAIPYLNLDFFERLAAKMPDRIRLLIAEQNDCPVAGAFFLAGPDSLYGRYWGCSKWIADLHFETCYYQPIEYCIETGRSRFEAGAQGEHKLSRGLLPAQIRSAHWLREPGFFNAVGQYVARESQDVETYRAILETHSPFKSEP